MKRCSKVEEPPSLLAYRQAQPNGTWEAMRNDPEHGGQQAYRDVKRSVVREQRCLCAYCEMRIAHGTSDVELDARKHEQRVEHFHSKSDTNQPSNWALHWPNLWAVCLGGSQSSTNDATRYLPPLPANLSCDAFKAHQVDAGRLPAEPEGWILDPGEVPAFPLLFDFEPNGNVRAHQGNCVTTPAPTNNRYPDMTTLVVKTIEHLNLGCVRLNRNRAIARAQLEKLIQQTRVQQGGAEPAEVLVTLARRLFQNDAHSPWREFFTLIRWRLDETAEAHLRAIGFAG